MDPRSDPGVLRGKMTIRIRIRPTFLVVSLRLAPLRSRLRGLSLVGVTRPWVPAVPGKGDGSTGD